MRKILVVEDEYAIRDLISIKLLSAGYDVVTVDSGERALETIGADPNSFDVALLDIMLPGMDGFAVCEALRRKNPRMGIIFLSARSQEPDKIRGLMIGADDYITKPFGTGELLARVEAVCRRIGGDEADSQMLSSGDIRLDLTARCAYKKGEPVELTQVELQMLRLFIENAGKALSRETILEAVWGRSFYGDVKVVDVNVRRLRVKIEDDPAEPQYITTVWGFGYRWNA